MSVVHWAQQNLEPSDPFFAASVANLGVFYGALGLWAASEQCLQQAVELYDNMVATRSDLAGSLARALRHLAVSIDRLGNHNDAELAIDKAIDIQRALAQHDPSGRSIDLAFSLRTKGTICYNLRKQSSLHPCDPGEAADESVRLFEQNNGGQDHHPKNTILAKMNLGIFLGPTEEGLRISEDAVAELRELVNGNSTDSLAYHDLLAQSLLNLSVAYVRLDRRHDALRSAKEAMGIYLRLRGTDRTRPDHPGILPFLARGAYNLSSLEYGNGNPDAAREALQLAVESESVFLQGQLPLLPEAKRIPLLQSFGNSWQSPFSMAAQHSSWAQLAFFTRLNRQGMLPDIERRQALVARASPGERKLVEDLSATIARLANSSLSADARLKAEEERQTLEQGLYAQLPALKPALVEPAEVAHALPEDGVLVEFQRYRRYQGSRANPDQWGDTNYLALLLDPAGSILIEDLGSSRVIDDRIQSALAAAQDVEMVDSSELWKSVFNSIFTPRLIDKLSGFRSWFIAPVGESARVPFMALVDLADSRSRIGHSPRIRILTSGRDLLPSEAPLGSADQPLVLANPSFTGWQPLEGTAIEGRQVAEALGVPLRQGDQATVKSLQEARGPRLLHVASHGFFEVSPESGDPLLASGIVLAGADRNALPGQRPATQPPSSPEGSGSPDDDGYLTAKEAARLELDGTQLVVLSACNTARPVTAGGEGGTGEGVYGLQRALRVAGAQSTLLSLWEVDDEATAWFMGRLYEFLLSGQDPMEALLAVQQELRTRPKMPGWSHPSYWAPWQLSGEAAPLRPTP